MERPKDSWHIPWSFHSRQWRGWRTIDWNPALSHQTESHNAVRKCMPLTMIQSASERECQESLWTKRYVISSPSNKIFLTSAQVSSLPTERARVSEVPLNSKQRRSLLKNYTNQLFLTFAHLSTFQTGLPPHSMSLSLSLNCLCLHLKHFNIKQRYFLIWRLVLVILYCTLYTVILYI